MSELQTLLTGLAIGESPRWHEGRLWFCNWGEHEIIAVDPEGHQRGRHARPGGQPALHRVAARPTGSLRLWSLLIIPANPAMPGAAAAPRARRVAGRPCRPERPAQRLQRDRRGWPRQHLCQRRGLQLHGLPGERAAGQPGGAANPLAGAARFRPRLHRADHPRRRGPRGCGRTSPSPTAWSSRRTTRR